MGYDYKLVDDLGLPGGEPSPQLADLIELVRPAFPGAEFHCPTPVRACVFYKEDVYAMGELKLVWDYAQQIYTYTVRSPYILKERGERYSTETTSIKTAAKNARKFFRRMNNAVAMSVQVEDAARAMFRANRAGEQQLSRLGRDTLVGYSVKPSDPIVAEFRHMLASGYAFQNPALRSKIEQLVAVADAVAIQPTQYGGTAVWMHEVDGETVFDVADISRFDTYGDCKVNPDYTRYRHDTLPETVAGKLSVLNMVEINHPVAGVGIRSYGNMFYLQK